VSIERGCPFPVDDVEKGEETRDLARARGAVGGGLAKG